MRPFIFVALSLVIAGCDLAQHEGVEMILSELVRSQLGAMAWEIGWRTLVGGILGLGLGIALFFAIRARSGFRLDWQHAKWVRAGTGVAYALVFAAVGGTVGFWQGTAKGTHEVVRAGQLGTEVLPIVGDAGSQLLAGLYVADTVLGPEGIEPDADARLVGHLQGWTRQEWHMDPEQTQAKLAALDTHVVALVSHTALEQVHAAYPDLEAGVAADLVEWVLDLLIAEGIDRAADARVSESIAQTLATLDEAAGPDDQLSHAELSAHIVERGVVPSILRPIDDFVRSQQIFALLVGLALVVISIAGFRLAEHQRRRSIGEQPDEGAGQGHG